MGCITSRKNWPQDTTPAFRYVYELVLVDGKWKKVLTKKIRRDDDRRQKARR
jgi:hypothetical protein